MSNYKYTTNGYDISEGISLEQIAQMLSRGELPLNTLLCEEGKRSWLPAETVLREANLYQPPATKKRGVGNPAAALASAAGTKRLIPPPVKQPPAPPSEPKQEVASPRPDSFEQPVSHAPLTPELAPMSSKPVGPPPQVPEVPAYEAAMQSAQPVVPVPAVGQGAGNYGGGAVTFAPVAPEPYTPVPKPVEHAGAPREGALSILERFDGENTTVEVLQYDHLIGSDDISIAESLYFTHQSGIRLKQVKIQLHQGSVIIESGALHFMKGRITATSGVGGVGGLAKKITSGMLTQEKFIKPVYEGAGEMFLEPSFGHFVIVHLEQDEVIVDKGMFYAAERTVQVDAAMQKTISGGLFGGEGWFQTRLRGSGWAVLGSPVPSREIVRYRLEDEKLQVDGNFALLRKGDIKFSVEKSAKSLFGTVAGGEGLLQTFTGTGEVWIAPTNSVYEAIRMGTLGRITDSMRAEDREK